MAPTAGPALAVAWASEPGHVGEVLVPLPGRPFVFGRGTGTDDDPCPRILLQRQRPGDNTPGIALDTPRVSRCQLVVRADGDELHVENRGMLPLFVGGARTDACAVRPGDVLVLGRQLVLLCVARPPFLLGDAPSPHAFGGADRDGLVGESPVAWALRERLAFLASRREHVLVLGPSGSGKEVAAQALHARGPRSTRAMVSRNAATLPEGLADAELFGNLKGYPHAGIAERPGLVGQAHGSTLFLDEIGDLPGPVQSHLLRVLDAGEYHRLGEATPRHSDFRLIAATNRPAELLRADVLARFQLRLELAPLASRREDVPLLLDHHVRRIASYDPVARRFLDDAGRPRLAPEWVAWLLGQPFATNVRAVEAAVWEALGRSTHDVLGEGLGMEHVVDARSSPPATLAPPSSSAPAELTREALERAMREHNGNLEKTWRALRLTSRYALRRLLQKHQVAVVRRP